MVKKLICTLAMSAFCIANSLAVTMTAGTANEFKDAATKSTTKDTIRLTADIDLTEYTMQKSFSGVIDGLQVINGDTICRIISKSRGKDGKTDTDNSPLFETVENATFQNVCIYNFRIERDNFLFGNDNLGAIARTAKNTKFKNMVFSDISVFSDDDYAGAIAGQAEGCTFYNVKCLNCDVTVDGDHAGGLTGYSKNCEYTSCLNNALSRVFADGSNPNAYAGGFTGESDGDKFYGCLNLALIGANDDRVGGISGYSTNTTFQMCVNSGYILQVDGEKSFNDVVAKFRRNIETFDKNYQENLAKYKDQLNDYYDTLDDYTEITRWSMFGTATAWMLTGMVAIAITNPITLTAAVAATIIMAAVWTIEYIIFTYSSHDELGGICGAGKSVTFDCCANYGGCYCRDEYAGGIIGLAEQVQGPDSKVSEFKNCLNAGEISGYEKVGGIAGEVSYGTAFSNCLSVGEITGRNGYHKICATGTKTNCYYKSVFYSTIINNETGVTDEQLESGQVAYWLNGGSVSADAPWRQTIGADRYPKPDTRSNIVTPDSFGSRIIINSADDLKALASLVNEATAPSSHIVYFSNDIDLDKFENWTPIGTPEKKFTGLVYGNGHTISNLNCDTTAKGAGLFGNIGNHTEIRDIILDASCHIKSTSYGVGGIVGCAEDNPDHDGQIVISGCGNMAKIEGTGDVGGIIGAIYTDKNMTLKMSNCFNASSLGISSENGSAAAMCGFAKDNAEISSCWNSGPVSKYQKDEAFARYNSNIHLNNCYQYKELGSGVNQKGVASFSGQDLTDGTLCYKLNGQSNITGDTSVLLPWEQNLGKTGSYPVPAAFGSQRNQAVYYTRSITRDADTTCTIGTIVLPFDVSSNDSVQYYVLDSIAGDNSSLHFTAVQTVCAGTPALFQTKVAGNLEFTSSDYEFEYKDLSSTKIQPDGSGWTMQGTYESRTFTEPEDLNSIRYISDNRIKTATSKLTIGSFRAYLVFNSIASGSPARVMSIIFNGDGNDDVITGITLIPADISSDYESSAGGTAIYNTGGQQLLIPASGISIIGGQKFYIE